MEKVLIVDDSGVFRKMLKGTLEAVGYEVLTAENGSQAIKILQQADSPDIILLDRIMPDMDGIEVCRWARRHLPHDNGSTYKYFIVLTAKDGQGDILHGFELGADDYVVKPFCGQELLARIAVGCRVLKLQRELWSAAIRDALTGLYNRRALYDLLAMELARAERDNRFVGVAVIDIDRFKEINDSYGHAAGDEALVALAEMLRSAMRGFDLVGRLGGEEFVLGFGCGDSDEAFAVCERVRQMIAATPISCGGADLKLSVSIGVAVVPGETAPTDAINYADKALYRAKANGRNCVVAC